MFSPKKNVVVCGYPKSGTTWLSRLVAELVDCPFEGDLGFSDGRALEGGERLSIHSCYKSHRMPGSLVSAVPKADLKIIYVVRDPRDVAISAAHHFRVNPFSWPASGRFVNAINARLSRIVPYTSRLNRTVNAVLCGDSSLSQWLAIPWRDHYREFRRSAALILKYEDLLDDTPAQCLRLLSYLGVEKSNEWIMKTVSNQSFENKKAFFASQGMTTELAFLRRGSSQYWRTELTQAQKRRFAAEIGEELSELAYPTD